MQRLHGGRRRPKALLVGFLLCAALICAGLCVGSEKHLMLGVGCSLRTVVEQQTL